MLLIYIIYKLNSAQCSETQWSCSFTGKVLCHCKPQARLQSNYVVDNYSYFNMVYIIKRTESA